MGHRAETRALNSRYHLGLHPESADRGQWKKYHLIHQPTGIRFRLVARGPDGRIALNWRCPPKFPMLAELPPRHPILLSPGTTMIALRPDTASLAFGLVVDSYHGPVKLGQRTGRLYVKGEEGTMALLGEVIKLMA